MRGSSSERDDLNLEALIHDLRNPIAAIQMNLDFLLDNLEGGEEQRAAVSESRLACRTVQRITAELHAVLAWGKAPPTLRREPIALVDLISSAEERTRELLAQGELVVGRAIDPELRVSVDRTLGRGLFEHLMAELAARTHRRGRLTIEAEAAGDSARVAFEHDGDVLAPAALAGLFEAGRAAPHGYRRLCLAYCQAVVEAHGGAIAAAVPHGGAGARFELVLPAGAALRAVRTSTP